ncbi:phosphopantetheine-binding protein [Rummeliibacillus pycnus]|uniref:phosphopantetheine-binding protein n=1 Tax=Rummeliibacillus pycnus TaxID=101070 RepID=UPI003D2A2464
MNIKEFTLLCEEILELEDGTLLLTTNLEEIEEWDSLAIMDILSRCDNEFNTQFPVDIFRNANTFQDVVDKIKDFIKIG